VGRAATEFDVIKQRALALRPYCCSYGVSSHQRLLLLQ
jgi:hypothetical protein